MPAISRPLRRPSLTALRASLAASALLLAASACASTGSAASPAGSGGRAVEQPPSAAWPVKTREHVDLWLHGYAMLQQDTARIPLFRRGYQEKMRAVRQGKGQTRLDANLTTLRNRLAANPALVNGQFLPLYFGSWDELHRAIEFFQQSNGNPNAFGDANVRTAIAIIGGAFPSGADREWLRTFVESLDDERTKWYRDWWLAEQRNRADAVTTVDSIWQQGYRAKFQRFLNATQQGGGEMMLVIALDGEGRTVSLGPMRNAVAVGEPETAAQANEAIYVFAHEVINAVTNVAINDNTTPAEQRSGAVGRYATHVTVRGGALLLQRIAPELVQGYMRYYLRAANQAVPAGNLDAAFAAAFPIPDSIKDAMTRQLDVVLGGI